MDSGPFFSKNQYSIGDWVSVTAKVIKWDDWSVKGSESFFPRFLKRCIFVNPIAGQVCGAKRIYTGFVHTPPNVRDALNEEALLEIKASHFLWLVRFGILNKPVMVIPGDIERADPLEKLPLLYQYRQTPNTPSYRKALSEAAKAMPRDKNGRFSKLKIGERA